MTSHHAHTPLHVTDKSVPHSNHSGAEQGASPIRSLLLEAGWRGPHVPHILTWRVLPGSPALRQMLEAQTYLHVQSTHTHTQGKGLQPSHKLMCSHTPTPAIKMMAKAL